MGVTVQLLHSEHRMPVFSAMMVGTVAGVAVLGTTLVSLARRTNNAQATPRRQRASVTEVLNVDTVDRGLCFTATNIDCSLDMELQQDTTTVEPDQVLPPPSGFVITSTKSPILIEYLVHYTVLFAATRNC